MYALAILGLRSPYFCCKLFYAASVPFHVALFIGNSWPLFFKDQQDCHYIMPKHSLRDCKVIMGWHLITFTMLMRINSLALPLLKKRRLHEFLDTRKGNSLWNSSQDLCTTIIMIILDKNTKLYILVWIKIETFRNIYPLLWYHLNLSNCKLWHFFT